MNETPNLLDQRPLTRTAIGGGLSVVLADIAAQGGKVASLEPIRHHPATYLLRVFYPDPQPSGNPG